MPLSLKLISVKKNTFFIRRYSECFLSATLPVFFYLSLAKILLGLHIILSISIQRLKKLGHFNTKIESKKDV